MPKPTDTADFPRFRLADLIGFRHLLVMLASPLPWTQIGVALLPCFVRATRPRLPIRSMMARLRRAVLAV